MSISVEALEMLEQRYSLKDLIEVPFKPEKTPRLIGEDKTKVETIFLLGEAGDRITTILLDETIYEALSLLGENATDVAYVLSREDETVAQLFHS